MQSYTLTVTAPGVTSPAVFTATTRAAAPASVTAIAGNNQTAPVGRVVPIEPAVRVNDAFGNPVAGVEVVFSVLTGGGSAVSRTPLTNADGIATVGGWTLGETVGTNTLRATVAGSGITGNPLTFTAIATAGAPATVAAQAGTGQTARVSSVVPVAPAVIVRDNRGNPVANVAVEFVIGTGGGTLTAATVSTNAAGVATVGSWTLGAAAGIQTLIARVNGLPDVVFSATATPGDAAAITPVNTLNRGSIAANAIVTPAPSVVVRDAAGNPVAGATVTFSLDDAGSGAVTEAVRTSDANGVATVGSWRVGTVAGTVSGLRVTVTGLDLGANTPLFTATVTAGPAAALAVAPGASVTQVGVANTGVAVPTPPAVRVTDAFSNPVSGASVLFVPNVGDGTVNGGAPNATIVTGANGIATLADWTIPAGAAANRVLAASLPALPAIAQVVFTAQTAP